MTVTEQELASKKRGMAKEVKNWYVEPFLDFTTLADFLNAEPITGPGEVSVATVRPDGSVVAYIYL